MDLSNTSDCYVTFQPIGRRIVVKAGTTLLEAARSAGLLLSANCGGVGLCGRCRVQVVSGQMYPCSENEYAYMDCIDHGTGVRLACEARVASSVVIEVPPRSFSSGQRVQTESTGSNLPCDPIIHSYQLSIEPPDLGDSRSDYKRVVDALKAKGDSRQWEILPKSVVQLSRIARATGWRFTAYGRSDEHACELIGFSDRDRPAIGLAVDVGCTKIAAYLRAGAKIGHSAPRERCSAAE